MILPLLQVAIIIGVMVWQNTALNAGTIDKPSSEQPAPVPSRLNQPDHNPSVQGIIDDPFTPSPSPAFPSSAPDPAVKSANSNDPASTPNPDHPNPPNPSPDAEFSDDCDAEYHYDSDEDPGAEDGEVNIERRCRQQTGNGTISNEIDLNINTGGNKSDADDNEGVATSDVKVDISVKNNAR